MLTHLQRLLSFGACSFVLSLAAGAQTHGGGPEDCPGCTGNLTLGTVVSMPGVTLTVEEGASSGQPTDPPSNNDGKCKIQHHECSQFSPCKFWIKYTLAVPAGTDTPYTSCTWFPDPPPGHWGDCITVTPHFTPANNGTHVENDVEMGCGAPSLTRIVSLAGASTQFTVSCSPCNP